MVSQTKIEEVNELVKLLESHPVVGIVDISGIDSLQLQSMRSKLRAIGTTLRISKKRLIAKALDDVEHKNIKQNVSKLKPYIKGQAGVILTTTNPFKLFKQLTGMRTSKPAKGGEIAPYDLVVKAGDTPFKPGPIIAELQRAGIPAGIERGKVVIKRQTVLVKQGERIPKSLAPILAKLEIKPLEVGINLHACYDSGYIFTPETLTIDETQIESDLITGVQNAYKLAYSIKYPSKEILPVLLQDAYKTALFFAIELSYPTPNTIRWLILRAYHQMQILKTIIGGES